MLVGEYPWEEGHADAPGIGPIENPALARHPATGEWLLTWSANRWETPAYATGLAICQGPLGPCHRVSRTSPWLRTSSDAGIITTTASFGGAGGLSFVAGPDGQLCVVFHAYSGSGQAPHARRVGWLYRVESDAEAEAAVDSAQGYRLVEIVGNQSAVAAVKGA